MKFEEYAAMQRDTVYKKILEYLPSKTPEEHYMMVRAYVDRRGKYTRPMLLTLWNELHGGRTQDAILPAAAMQTSEDWILMHDDWMDGNKLRRGKEAAHILYGDRFAVNAGDALHMIMWKMAHDAATQLGNPRGSRYYDKFYDILLVTAEGQYLDVRLTHKVKDISGFTLEDYYRSISAKSGYYSVYGPMQLGAILANQPQSYVDSIKEYGEPIGKAFQIKDDILDCTSSERVLGKTISNDIIDGVKTAILWHFAQKASEPDLADVQAIYSKSRSRKRKRDVKTVIQLFQKYGSIKYAEELVDAHSKQGLDRFEKISSHLKESDLKEAARDAIVRLASRNR